MSLQMNLLTTAYPPKDKPLLVWDGACDFCKYWVQKWEHYFGDRFNYAPYQQAASRFSDLSRDQFRKAVQLIDTDGRVYPGAATVYHSMCIGQPNICGPEELYNRSAVFRQVSDVAYDWISNNRSLMYKVTVGLLGKDPNRTKPYWAYWLLGIAGAGAGLAFVLRNRRFVTP